MFLSSVQDNSGQVKAEFSFEYLQTKDKLEWITVSSEQAVIMAACLQEIVTNMVSKSHPSNPSMIGVRDIFIASSHVLWPSAEILS